MADFRPVPVLRFLRAYPCRTAAAALTGLFVGVLGWGMALFLQHVVDHSRDLGRLHFLALGVAFVLLVRGGASIVRRSLQVQLARRIESDLADRYVDHVTRLEMRFYERFPTGDLLSRLRGIEVFRNALEDRFLGVVFDAVLVVMAAVVMMQHSVSLALLACLGAAFPAIVIVCLRDSIKRSFESIRRLDGELSNRCMDALIGIRDLRLTEGEAWVVRRIKESYRGFQEFRIVHIMRLTWLAAATILVSSLTGLGVLVLGARLVGDATLTQGQLMFLFMMAGTMLGPLEQLASSWIAFDEASVAFSRYDELLLLPAEPRAPEPTSHEVRGRLRLEGVSFGYRPDEPILREVTLDLEPGSSLALVGESGAGKSTLLALLAGLYLPDGGRLLLDGIDLRQLGLARLRESTAAVFQNPHLFEASIEENIRMGRWSATMDEVREAARLAHADDFIMRFPERYRTPVRNGGQNLSGGQVQRIALARALVSRPRILLLDEATGNLDVHTEAAIWSTLTRSALGCTRLFITHRLSTTTRMDRIAVMDRGRILEIGTFQELLSQDGAFRRLWERQTAAGAAAR